MHTIWATNLLPANLHICRRKAAKYINLFINEKLDIRNVFIATERQIKQQKRLDIELIIDFAISGETFLLPVIIENKVGIKDKEHDEQTAYYHDWAVEHYKKENGYDEAFKKFGKSGVEHSYFVSESLMVEGKKIIICNQWGGDMTDFLSAAEDVGYHIEAIK